ncbi:MAG: hypothetical protein KTR20_15890 [Cellvibrionaceae bacterium]|nr:hypothetical protein [Cellvibrionaceae bacterium]
MGLLTNMAQTDTPEKRNKKSSLLQVGGLIGLLLALMVTSVATSLMAVGIIDLFPKSNGKVHSMTDAQFICDKALRAEHGEALRSFVVDDHSSHFDDASGRYKMFYEIDMFKGGAKQQGVNKFYANCFVSANGRIRNMDLFEEKSYVPKAVRRTKGNAFGI